ncbi:unnamed protein product [Dicrocoelium dendriticum]|nr:unnamed protein product [Dicrocoelium dendriticum]
MFVFTTRSVSGWREGQAHGRSQLTGSVASWNTLTLFCAHVVAYGAVGQRCVLSMFMHPSPFSRICCLRRLPPFLSFSRSIVVGDQIKIVRKFTQEDVNAFSVLSGDNNPIHIDPEFARKTQYGQCIVHGTLVLGLLSCLFGSRYPGPGCVLADLSARFSAPLFVGESCQINTEVMRIEKRFVTVSFEAVALEREASIIKGQTKVVFTKDQLSLEPPKGVIQF